MLSVLHIKIYAGLSKIEAFRVSNLIDVTISLATAMKARVNELCLMEESVAYQAATPSLNAVSV